LPIELGLLDKSVTFLQGLKTKFSIFIDTKNLINPYYKQVNHTKLPLNCFITYHLGCLSFASPILNHITKLDPRAKKKVFFLDLSKKLKVMLCFFQR